MIMLVVSAFQRFSMGSTAYPIQPISSQAAAMKYISTRIGIDRKGMFGSGSDRPIKLMNQYDSNMIIGIKNSMGKYQLFCLIRL